MLFRFAALTSLALAAPVLGDHAMASSLIQLGNNAPVDADSVLSMINQQVSDFQKKMASEISSDKEEVRKLQDQQRMMQRDEKAFKARIFTHNAPGSFVEGATTHFGDPYIDEAMRTIGDDLESQKRELEGIVATHHTSLIEQKENPSLDIIQSALRARQAMGSPQ